MIWMFLAFYFSSSFSEPWISNRFAKNCAACHAPGRVNVEPKKRRCTLSCQGCHVNPNGGGLRNNYGKWNQDYWLKSFETKTWLQQKPHPKPYKQQPYYHVKVNKKLKKRGKNSANVLKKLAEKGIPFETSQKPVSEKDHDRVNGADEHTVEKDWNRVMARIPKGDPWRTRREQYITASGDFRFFNLMTTTKTEGAADRKISETFPMAFDFGLRAMPINKVSFVGEARFENRPSNGADFERQFDSGYIRSAYFMVDDLMYNTFIMSGLYRPLFGYYNVDHNSLSSKITGLGYRYIANVTTIGTNPNVPFFQIHMMNPIRGQSSRNKEKGMIINAGGRFIKYGASFMFSSWNTQDDSNAASKSKREMNSLTFGFSEWDVTGNFDFVSYKKRVEGVAENKGFYWLADIKYRFWKEFYLTTTYASANTATDLSEGSASDLALGVKTFPVSGVEFEILTVSRINQPTSGSKTQTDGIQTQLHWFF